MEPVVFPHPPRRVETPMLVPAATRGVVAVIVAEESSHDSTRAVAKRVGTIKSPHSRSSLEVNNPNTASGGRTSAQRRVVAYRYHSANVSPFVSYGSGLAKMTPVMKKRQMYPNGRATRDAYSTQERYSSVSLFHSAIISVAQVSRGSFIGTRNYRKISEQHVPFREKPISNLCRQATTGVNRYEAKVSAEEMDRQRGQRPQTTERDEEREKKGEPKN